MNTIDATISNVIHIMVVRIKHEINLGKSIIRLPNIIYNNNQYNPSDIFDNECAKNKLADLLSNASCNVKKVNWGTRNTYVNIEYKIKVENTYVHGLNDVLNIHTDKVNKDTEVCSICLSNLDKGKRCIATLACMHSFHYECMSKWIDHNEEDGRKCPMCRQYIYLRDL